MFDRSTLTSNLIANREAREAYVRSKLNVLIPAQIRGLRLSREQTQQELGLEADMKQARISAMESPGEVNFNLETLVRLASAFRVGLMVKFVPYTEMLDWDNSFSQDLFAVTPVEGDESFLNPDAVTATTHYSFVQSVSHENTQQKFAARGVGSDTILPNTGLVVPWNALLNSLERPA